MTGKKPTETVPFADLFTLAGGALVSDFNITYLPAGSATNDAAGLITVASGAAVGDINVTATAKVAGDFVSGKSTATAKIGVIAP